MAKGTFGKELCEALGLDPEWVFSIKLISTIHEADTLEILQYADVDKYKKIGKVFKKYRLVPLSGDPVVCDKLQIIDTMVKPVDGNNET